MSDTIDPTEVDDFPWDWSTRLKDGETITSHTVTIVGANATVNTSTVVGSTVTARLSGASGDLVKAKCTVVTSAGRTLDDTWVLLVQDH